MVEKKKRTFTNYTCEKKNEISIVKMHLFTAKAFV